MKTNKTYLSSSSLHSRSFFPYSELRRKQYGMKPKLGWSDELKRRIYSSLQPSSHWESSTPSVAARPILERPEQRANDLDDDDDEEDIILVNPAGYGGVFNLEFSPDGRILAAACQNKAVVLFDPLTHAQTGVIPRAHTDCVNGTKFLDNRFFASCSDDQTIAVWDVRNLKQKVFSLIGHTKWVKNIEYHHEEKKIITSGFDGHVISWDINRFMSDKNTVHHEELLNLRGLMRMKISPDLNKLLLCTAQGYMLLIQDLELEHFQRDMQEFMRLDVGSSEELNIMGRSRNRPVIIKDFPAVNRAEIIHSMQIHPHSWAVVSRNTSMDDESEWTCVHDIQEFPVADEPLDVDDRLGEDGQRVSGRKEEAQEATNRGTLPSPRDLPEMNPYFTPRFQFLLDNRGGNWFEVRREVRRRRQAAIDVASLALDVEVNPDDDSDSNENFRALEEEGAQQRQLLANHLLERDRLRAINYSLNYLMQENRASLNNSSNVGSSYRREGSGAREEERDDRRRRAGSRGRAALNRELWSHNRDLYVASRDGTLRSADRFHARTNRRLNMLNQRFSEIRSSVLREEEPILNVELESGPMTPPRIFPNELRNWSIRNDEIRQTLHSLRSGLELVMENLNSVRRQIDSDVGRIVSEPYQHRSRLFHSMNSRNMPLTFPSSYSTNYISKDANIRKAFAQQRPRLTHYISEPNVGQGFIKEVCFSTDGRLLCSPYKNGVRLLMFDENCSEMSHCVREGRPQLLSNVHNITNCHSKSVVSTKFSPTHTLLVSGCLGGKITWHQPKL